MPAKLWRGTMALVWGIAIAGGCGGVVEPQEEGDPTLAAEARGGKHPTASTGTCSVTPNPVPVGAWYAVTGSSYSANQFLTVSVSESNGTSFAWVQCDANGAFILNWRTFTVGTGMARVYDSVRGTLLTSCSFTVQ